VESLGDNVNGGKVMKHLIVVTGLMLIATRAFAGESDFEGVNNCAGNTPTPMVQCLQQRLDNMSAACFDRHGSDGKSVTRKQWLACGLSKRDFEP